MAKDEVPDDVDACEMCGASFAGVSLWHQNEPVERWLCCGCQNREASAIKRGTTYRAAFFPNAE